MMKHLLLTLTGRLTFALSHKVVSISQTATIYERFACVVFRIVIPATVCRLTWPTMHRLITHICVSWTFRNPKIKRFRHIRMSIHKQNSNRVKWVLQLTFVLILFIVKFQGQNLFAKILNIYILNSPTVLPKKRSVYTCNSLMSVLQMSLIT